MLARMPAPAGGRVRRDALMLFTTAPEAAPAGAAAVPARDATLLFSGSDRALLAERLRMLAACGGGDTGAAVSAVMDMLNKVRGVRGAATVL